MANGLARVLTRIKDVCTMSLETVVTQRLLQARMYDAGAIGTLLDTEVDLLSFMRIPNEKDRGEFFREHYRELEAFRVEEPGLVDAYAEESNMRDAMTTIGLQKTLMLIQDAL